MRLEGYTPNVFAKGLILISWKPLGSYARILPMIIWRNLFPVCRRVFINTDMTVFRAAAETGRKVEYIRRAAGLKNNAVWPWNIWGRFWRAKAWWTKRWFPVESWNGCTTELWEAEYRIEKGGKIFATFLYVLCIWDCVVPENLHFCSFFQAAQWQKFGYLVYVRTVNYTQDRKCRTERQEEPAMHY